MAQELDQGTSFNYRFTQGRRDLLSIVGISSAFFLIYYAISNEGGFGQFLNLNAFMIVFGGTIAATFISYPAHQVFKVVGIFLKIFARRVRSVEEIIMAVVKLSVTSKRGGFLALEKEEKKIGDAILRSSLTMVVDGLPVKVIKETMASEIETTRERHLAGQQIFLSMAAFAPAFGMIGTIIGLIKMLSSLQDPSSIGPAMAIALITTFYGAIMANFIFIPISEKLKTRMNDEILLRKVIMEGIVGLRMNLDTRVLETRLNAFVSSKKKIKVKFK
jgi:chemotaxis protein MotA